MAQIVDTASSGFPGNGLENPFPPFPDLLYE
jgi:hypothetical protein